MALSVLVCREEATHSLNLGLAIYRPVSTNSDQLQIELQVEQLRVLN